MIRRNQPIAVVDWDGTFRRGFTILDWVHFVSLHRHFEPSVATELDTLYQDYQRHLIVYESFATQAASLYSQGLKGLPCKITRNLAAQFVLEDRSLFGFAKPVFNTLLNHGLGIVVVSGAPEVVLEVYRHKYLLLEVFGLKTTVSDDEWTGEVQENPATSSTKRHQVEALRERYEIVVGIGNTESDRPLLNAARLPILVETAESARHEPIKSMRRVERVRGTNLEDYLNVHLRSKNGSDL